MGTVTVATWKIHALRGASPSKLARVARMLANHRVDVVALQEVRFGDVTALLLDELRGIGLVHSVWSARPSGSEDERPKGYGTLLAGRFPMAAIPWPSATRWPQLITAADVDTAVGSFRLVGVHIPNGSGNGWEKVYAFEALAVGLETHTGPIVLAGDFNEPSAFEPTFTSFGLTRRGSEDGLLRDAHGVTHPRSRWQNGVARVLDPDPAHRGWMGQHAERRAGLPFEPTHLVRGRFVRYFDHILTTPEIPVSGVIYDHAVRMEDPRISDHSLVVAHCGLVDTAPVSYAVGS